MIESWTQQGVRVLFRNYNATKAMQSYFVFPQEKILKLKKWKH